MTAMPTSTVTDAEILAAVEGPGSGFLVTGSLRRGIASGDPVRLTTGRRALACSLRNLDYPADLMTTVLDACERAIRAEQET